MIDRVSRCIAWTAAAAVLLIASSGRAVALVQAPVVTFNGGTGDIVFGVAPYGGAPNIGGPTYIANNFTGANDILSSPGKGTLGGYLTASPVVANNIQSIGPGALPLVGFQVGGGNASGNFGAGSVANLGTVIGATLSDSGPGGGSASYEIASGITSYTVHNAAVPAGSSFGAFLSMGGSVPLIGNADVASLIVHVSDTAGVFGAGGTDLPQLVLAISRNGAGGGVGNYNIVTIGGVGGGNAALILDNGNTGTFRSLAVDNLATPGALPIGDLLTVTYTFTAFADPASISTFDPTGMNDLLDLTGPLPTLGLVDTAAPEPSSIALMGGGVLCLAGYSVRNSRKRRAQAA